MLNEAKNDGEKEYGKKVLLFHKALQNLQSQIDQKVGKSNKLEEENKRLTSEVSSLTTKSEQLLTDLKHTQQRLESFNSDNEAKTAHLYQQLQTAEQDNKALKKKLTKLTKNAHNVNTTPTFNTSDYTISAENIIGHLSEALRIIDLTKAGNGAPNTFRAYADFFAPLPLNEKTDLAKQIGDVNDEIFEIQDLVNKQTPPPKFLFLAACKNLENKLKLMENSVNATNSTEARQLDLFFKFYIDTVASKAANLSLSQTTIMLHRLGMALSKTLTGEQLWEQDILN